MKNRHRSTSTSEWQIHTQQNLEVADKQHQNSNQMRNLIEGILKQIADDQSKQVDSTNWALKKRITEIRDAKGKLEEHLGLVSSVMITFLCRITFVKR